MGISRHNANKVRNQLDMILPDAPREPLPPQPSILGAPAEPRAVRYARRASRISQRMRRVSRPYNLLVRTLQDRPESIASIRESVHFVDVQEPTFSIVIPVFNKFAYTVSCLRSIMANVPESLQFEVVVVDNASSDKTIKLSSIKGLRYIRNKQNEGFVGGCNIGAAQSRGKYLVFLNNDALVTPGWLESLYTTITERQDVGLVGSKILYMDGRLQEAGGIIYDDGSGCNYGKNDHPDRYQYNYVREVDYCSGASIIISSQLFNEFGGFDVLYAPAYYEDTDLSFKVRKRGLKVLYQPQSVIYHIEGGTSGTDISSGFKKYQAINRKKFLRRWSNDLKTNHLTSKDEYAARDRAGQKMALLVDELIPTPDEDSGSVRMFRIIQVLQSLGYKVTFYANYVLSGDRNVAVLQQMGVEVVYGPTVLSDIVSKNGKYYDLVMLSRPRIASYYMDLCDAYCQNAKIIFDTVDLHYVRLNRQIAYEPDPADASFLKLAADRYEQLERYIMSEADATLVVSATEKKLLEKSGVDNVALLSNIHTVHDDAYASTFNNKKDLLFVGGYRHLPNIDAVKWFVDEIFPLIQKDIPRIKLHVVGSHMPDSLRAHLAKRRGVIIDGYVSDEALGQLLTECRVFVAPLRFGAGVKGKIGQAIEYGIPMVSSSVGAEGMYLKDGVSAFVANAPEEFAKRVVQLYSDEQTWNIMRQNARKVLEKYFSVDQAYQALVSVLQSTKQKQDTTSKQPQMPRR